MNDMEQLLRRVSLGRLANEWRSVQFENPEQYLHDLLTLELREREAARAARMRRQAGIPVVKTLDSFIWRKTMELPASITRKDLECASFVQRRENLILLGTVGTGKTHLATAIALELCEQGRHVRFFTAAGLANLLIERNKRGLLSNFMETLKKAEMIVIDEVGFVPLHKEAAELLFQVISGCYEQKSLIITSNLEFSQWNTVLGDNRLTAALIDRLIHHSHIVVFGGESFRLEESMRRQKEVTTSHA
jgi:DNA replication protein DnaC